MRFRLKMTVCMVWLLTLACGLSYMFSGYHSLYSSQGFRTSKLFSEFLQPKEEK